MHPSEFGFREVPEPRHRFPDRPSFSRRYDSNPSYSLRKYRRPSFSRRYDSGPSSDRPSFSRSYDSSPSSDRPSSFRISSDTRECGIQKTKTVVGKKGGVIGALKELEKEELELGGVSIDKSYSLEASGKDVPKGVSSFGEMGLSSLEGLQLRSSLKPNCLQSQAIPILMAGRDLFAYATTQAANISAFCLPIIDRISKAKRSKGGGVVACPRALILCPTTQVSSKVTSVASRLASFSKVKAVVVQECPREASKELLNRDVDMLIGTPAALVGMVESGLTNFCMVKVLTLVEGDNLLTMGSGRHIKKLVKEIPKAGVRQTIIFTTSFPMEIVMFASSLLSNYISLTRFCPSASSDSDDGDIVSSKVLLKNAKERFTAYALLTINHYNLKEGLSFKLKDVLAVGEDSGIPSQVHINFSARFEDKERMFFSELLVSEKNQVKVVGCYELEKNFCGSGVYCDMCSDDVVHFGPKYSDSAASGDDFDMDADTDSDVSMI